MIKINFFQHHSKSKQPSTRQKQFSRRGDTFIEVTFAIGIFSVVSVIAINLMNSGLQTAQSNLEITMARTEIDAQADALRFIQNSYIADRSYVKSEQTYRNLWLRLTGGGSGSDTKGLAYSPDDSTIKGFNQFKDSASASDNLCSASFYNNAGTIYKNAFIINTRNLDPADPTSNPTIIKNNSRFIPTQLYPRIIYGSNSEEQQLYESSSANRAIKYVEGIWILSVKDEAKGKNAPEFYDFHIRTCWYAPGNNYPNTIATVIRLYNPDAVEGDFN